MFGKRVFKILAMLANSSFTFRASSGKNRVGPGSVFFFFQAEDGIRDATVTGVRRVLFRSVWSEIPVYWDIAWKSPAALANARLQLRDMIARDHNRAAVILWSLSNETPVDPDRLIFLRTLAEDARQLDPTRLITSAMNRVEDDGADGHILRDPLGQFLDVLGLNEYFGWYYGRPEDADRQTWTSIYDKPLIVSEFGGDAAYARHGAAAARWTEEYQASLFVHLLIMVNKISPLAVLS